jgi:hypothetical protein
MNIKIIKLKARRGSNNERKTVILDQGEIVYTVDTKRLFVGNGVLSGGDVVGNKNHLPVNTINALSSIPAEVGDLTSINGVTFQLSALPPTNISNWIALSSNTQIGLSSLSANQLNPVTVNNGIKIENNTLQINFNSNFFQISANQLSLKPSGVNEREINSTTFGNGISGGSGNVVSLNIDPVFFSFNSGRLSFNIPINDLTVTGDNVTIENNSGTLSLVNLNTPLSAELASIIVDDYGRVIQGGNSIFDTLTGFDTVNTLFNGTPNQSLSGGISGLTLTLLSAISSNSVYNEITETTDTFTTVVTLSSAGFIVFEGNSTSRSGKSFGRFAIPIFTY